MKESEKILFDAVKNYSDGLAEATINLVCTPLEIDPDAEVPDLNQKDESGLTLLHYAVKRGLDNTVISLLEKGAKADVKDNVESAPLHLAVQRKFDVIVGALLKKGASVDIKDAAGNTPLVLTMQTLLYKEVNVCEPHNSDKCNFEIVTKLVEAGADISATDSGKENSDNCVHFAVKKHQDVVLNILLTKTANSTKALKATDDTLMKLTPLHLASLAGDKAMVSYLLEAKADPNFKSPARGDTALHCAVDANNPDVVRLLMKAGADVNLGLTKYPQQTPLAIAKKKKYKEVLVVVDEETKNLTQSSSSIKNTFAPTMY
jgi:ankyrin repeat protein